MIRKRMFTRYWFGFVFSLFTILSAGGFSTLSADTRSSRIPDVLVSFGPEQGSEYAVVVEKSTQSLYIYSSDGSYRKTQKYTCSTGESVGAKTRSGDSKTPEGVYFFTKRFKKRELSAIYGTRAFPIDYPNILDRLDGRSGNAIWLHGTNKPLKPRDSNGCIVLENPNIDAVDQLISFHRTPIIIVDTLSYTTTRALKPIRKSVLNFISAWNHALEKGTYHDYLSYYHPDYLPDIDWWTAWNRSRNKSTAPGSKSQIGIEKVSIYRHKEVYVTLFDQSIPSAKGNTLVGTRKLFLQNSREGLRIIGDVFQTHPFQKKGKKRRYPLLAAIEPVEGKPVKTSAEDKPVKVSASGKAEIKKMIAGWLKAWSAKDIRRYGAYYATGFRAQGMNRKAWLRYKNRLNKKYRYIKVSQKKLAIQEGKKRSIARFVQTYKSSKTSGVGKKRLVLIKENGRWKIYRETWKKL